jgi:hypothetical protein
MLRCRVTTKQSTYNIMHMFMSGGIIVGGCRSGVLRPNTTGIELLSWANSGPARNSLESLRVHFLVLFSSAKHNQTSNDLGVTSNEI